MAIHILFKYVLFVMQKGSISRLNSKRLVDTCVTLKLSQSYLEANSATRDVQKPISNPEVFHESRRK